MRRTLQLNRVGLCGFALLAALVAVRDWPFAARTAAGAVLFAAALVCFVVSVKQIRPLLRSIGLALLAAALGVGLLTVHLYRQEAALAGVIDRPVEVVGRVSDLPEYDGRFRYPLTLEEIDGRAVSGVEVELISRTDLRGELGDAVRGTVLLTPMRERADGVFARAKVADDEAPLSFTAGEGGLRTLLLGLRKKLSAALDEMFDGEVRGVVKGVLMGDTLAMSEDLAAAFRAAGLAHGVVVSGMHLSVVSGIFLVLLQLLTGFRRRLSAAVALIPTLAFLILSGGTPSALRATVAVTVFLVGILVDEDGDPITALGWAVILLTLVDPVLPTQLGFLLSCAAVLGLTLLARRGAHWVDRRYYRRFCRPTPKGLTALARLVCVILGAQLGTLPLILLFSSRVSVVGLFANLLTNLTFCGLLLFGALGALTLAVGLEPVGRAFFALSGLCARWILLIVKGAARLPSATLPVKGVWVLIAAAIALAALIFCVWRKKTRLGALICAAVIACCGAGSAVISHTAATVIVTESGCVIRDPEGGLTLVGFDYAYAGAYDASRVAAAFGATTYDVVVWDDFSAWSRLPDASLLLTGKPVEGTAISYEKQITGPATLTRGGVTLDRRADCTLVTLNGATFAVADRAVDPATLPEADFAVLPQPYRDDAAPRLIRWGLAPEERSVYNESGCDYVLTVWPGGAVFIEKG
ncbi:MAG: ComEC/Rec2 family competence protein [Clostridia bacterium]|nr:ComEC/Rec2 family competence protein [Clostridia bacterium]